MLYVLQNKKRYWMFIFNIPTMISIPKLVIDMMITTTYIPIVV